MGLQKKSKIRLEGSWDFDEDGGAVGSYPLIDVPANFAVQELYYEVETALTSGGTPTVEIGDGDDPNGYVADFQASMDTPGIKALNQDDKGVYLWDNANDAGDQKLYAAADTIDFVVGTAALTAGKIRVVVYGERAK
jgi:hypothetical protein